MPPSHVGVLVPWANTTVETELPRLGLADVVWHYARLVPDQETTALDDSFLAGLVHAIPSALHQLSQLPLSAVAVACTSAGFSFSAGITAAATAELPLFTAFDALVAALHRLNASRVVLLTPYPATLTEREINAFGPAGIEVLASTSLGLRDGFADVDAGTIGKLLATVDPSAVGAAEAIVLSCTAWPTLAAACELEDRLGRPVISSNIAMAINAASISRLAGAR
jgi:maleate isomerase